MAEEAEGGERTEDPTQRRRDEALERGDVVKSQEVNTFFMLAGGLLVLFAFGGSSAAALRPVLEGLLGRAHQIPADSNGLMALMPRLGLAMATSIVAPLLVLFLAAVFANVVQHRLVWSASSLKPKLDRISPASGAKRLFSKQAFVNFAKGLFKLALVGALMGWLLWPEAPRLEGLAAVDLAAVLPLTHDLALKLLAATAASLLVIAAADYLYQYQVWFGRQKMSLRELKEEFKQTDGDPAIKGKLRQLRQSRMRKRMMAAVPKASVVIMNPTHYAVALQYERGMNAPLCVAKGFDSLALRIRDLAQAHAVPIVQNAPLARALHASVEVDQEIPAEHYKTVAEVIGYVMRLRRHAASGPSRAS